jgi:hypothetical protein
MIFGHQPRIAYLAPSFPAIGNWQLAKAMGLSLG